MRGIARFRAILRCENRAARAEGLDLGTRTKLCWFPTRVRPSRVTTSHAIFYSRGRRRSCHAGDVDLVPVVRRVSGRDGEQRRGGDLADRGGGVRRHPHRHRHARCRGPRGAGALAPAQSAGGGHSHDGLREPRDRHRRPSARRVGLSREAVLHRRAERARGARARAARGPVERAPALAGRASAAGGRGGPRRRERRDARPSRADRPDRPHPEHRADHGGERSRQGAGRARGARGQLPPRPALHCGQLRRDPRSPAREPALRACARRVHDGRAGQSGPVRRG